MKIKEKKLIPQTHVSYPPLPLGMKISYLVGLRYGFEEKKIQPNTRYEFGMNETHT